MIEEGERSSCSNDVIVGGQGSNVKKVPEVKVGNWLSLAQSSW